MDSNYIRLRRGTPEDAAACGRIAHDAFEDIAARHNFPKDMASVEEAVHALASMLGHPGFYGVVAERGERILGSNFMDERSTIYGVGPITVDPRAQDAQVGRQLMQAAIDRAAERGAPGVRLLQDAFHNRSFALYTRLGYEMRVTTSVMQGDRVRYESPGGLVRLAVAADLEPCNQLCRRVHGHDRGGELGGAITHGRATVVERAGRIAGYTTGVAFFGHSVGETNEDLKALIGAAPGYGGPGFHVPNSNGELLRWCYANGLRMVKAMTLMTIGLYNEPNGAYLPSISY